MLYFYSAVAYTEEGEMRVANVKEIKNKIDSEDSFWIEAKIIQEEICSECKKQHGLELEPDNIVFTAFNSI